MRFPTTAPSLSRSASRLRLAFLADTYFGGGGEKQALMTARALAEDPEVELTLISLTPQPSKVWDYVDRHQLKLITLRRRVELDPLTLAGLFRLWIRLRPQVVDAWLARPALWAALTLPPGARLICHLLNSGLKDEARRIPSPARQRLSLRLIRPRLDLVAVNNPKGLSNWRSLAGISPARSVYLPNYFEPSPLTQPGAGELAALREELKLEEEEVVVLAVGRLLLPEKGQHDLIRAVAELIPTHPRLRLLIAGDGPHRGELEGLAEELGIAKWASFLGWREDVEPLYHLAHLVVLPSRTEGFPNALLEALLCRRPVVATDVGAVADILEGGRLGRLVPPGNPHELARAMAEVLSELSRWQERAAEGAEVLVRKYAPGRVLRAFLRLHRELCGGRRDFSQWRWEEA